MRTNLSQRTRTGRASGLALRLKQTIARDQIEGTLDTVRNYIKYGDFWWRCVAMPNYRED